ncbi:high affinity cationic amino acid transporter 1-like [Ctenocephalides felis]|uniref:high affinity cationic amino acid transporter 1-like n=1 Tax=Ctenocephalides felis TaxID=7515 RepID=UPI000E6E1881|nr:high affinity cationic amino acid transporter 1-like [Ctenocephalides felis]
MIFYLLQSAASVVKAISTYLDALIGKVISNYLREHLPIDVSFLSPYPDFFAFGVTMLFTIALAFGAKESSRFNNLFTLVNLAVVGFFVAAGAVKADASNWSLPPTAGHGDGGFAPYGIVGIIAGASKCFYGFIGFDCVCLAGEEAKNPKKSLPIAVIGSLFITFLSYFSISTVLTMLLPYYEQDVDAPLTHAFELLGWTTPQYIVSIGAIFGLCASLMGSMFPLPRIIYAMASDGLLFEFMGRVHPRFKTPFLGTLLAGFLTGLMALFFDLEELVDMMSIGTLLAYSMVAACVMLLRYEIDRTEDESKLLEVPSQGVFHTFFNVGRRTKAPTVRTSAIVTWSATSYTILCLSGCLIATKMDGFSDGEVLPVVLVGVIAAVALMCLLIIARQPPSSAKLSFTVPFVPWLPALSILINVFLMMSLSVTTWVRFMIWIVVGLLIYFGYGLWHSHERESIRKKLLAKKPPPPATEKSSEDHENGYINGGFEAQL